MAQTTVWQVLDMKRASGTGAVDTVYWECRVQDDTHTECQALEAGKLRLTPDTSASDFIAYASLKESDVLGWIYKSLIEGDETADEAKARIEKVRQDKVTAQVARKTSEASGMPWAS